MNNDSNTMVCRNINNEWVHEYNRVIWKIVVRIQKNIIDLRLQTSMEDGSLVSESLLTSTQGSKVLSSLWNNIVEQFKDNSTCWIVSNGNIEEDFWSGHDFVSRVVCVCVFEIFFMFQFRGQNVVYNNRVLFWILMNQNIQPHNHEDSQ